jgi:UDP-glucuronate 4-epimerase
MLPQKRKVLITGVAGFIGSHLADLILKSGAQVVGIDSINPYYSVDLKNQRVNQLKQHNSFEFYQVNLADFNSVEEIISENVFSSIFHLAAQAGVRIPIGKLQLYSTNNLVAFSNILELAVKYKVRDFLFASSSSVYGNDASIPFLETEKNLNPTSYYGATKLSNEILAKTLVVGSDTRARGLRFFTVYGPGGRPDMAYFRLIASCVSGETFNLNGDGRIKRDFTYIGDVVETVMQLETDLKRKSAGFFDVVNVGGGNPTSMKELISLISELTGSLPNIVHSAAVSSDVNITSAGSAYLESLIGQVPMTRLEKGLPSTIEWALRQENLTNLKKWIESVE